MEDPREIWRKYNEYANRMSVTLGGTSNIVGEYAEYLAFQYYGGKLLKASSKSVDIEGADGQRYQVKARRIDRNLTTQLGVIRSWDFDWLVAIFFDRQGNISKALKIPVHVAKEYAVANAYQNGFVITTNRQFFDDPRCENIADIIGVLMLGASKSEIDHAVDLDGGRVTERKSANMKKRDILRVANVTQKKGVHIANENKTTHVWWLDIPEAEIEANDLSFITFVLCDKRERLLHVLEIPVDFLRSNIDRLRFFPKKTGNFRSFHLSVEQRSKFQNVVPSHSGLNFSKFVKRSVIF